jgi:hypothetical protein
MGWCETVWRRGRSSETVCNLNLGLLLYNGLGPGVVLRVRKYPQTSLRM